MAAKAKGNPKNEVLWLQWIAGIAAMIALFITGLMRGWSSPYLAQLTAENSPIPITTDEAAWVASLINLGRLVGAILGAVSVYFFTNKNVLIVAGFPLALGWVMVIVANSASWLYVARFTSGFAMGIIYSSFPLYLGEVSSPSIRGTLVTLAMSGVTLGILAGNIMGTYVSMAVFAYVSLIPTVLVVLIFVWLPESPHDLIRMGRSEKAKLSIHRYNPSLDVDNELEHVKEFVNTSHSTTFWERLREFNRPHNRRAGVILVLLFLFMQFSGLNTISFYMETVLTNAMLTAIEPAMLVIIVNCIGTVAAILATYTADKCGRKKLLVGSSAGICVSMIGLGLHFTFIDSGFNSNTFQWLPIVSIILYQVSLCLGHAMIPNVVLSELFAPRIKSIASFLAGLTTGAFAFVSSRSYQTTVDAFGIAYVFWIHAVIMILSIIFVLTLMPETKCKTLQEIQVKLEKRSISRVIL